jgi:tetrapyrrole methylase family protein/MazG family protein
MPEIQPSPASAEAGELFARFVELIARLRAPGGCPWDRAQTHRSLRPYLIEEAYEVVDAIDQGHPGKLMEELGDLLGQVIFHSQLARERGRFDVDRAIGVHIAKMERRHPHIFGGAKVGGVRQVLENWEQIKRGERKAAGLPSLHGVPRHLPALLKARRVQEKASRLGLEWEGLDQALAAVEKGLGDISRNCSRGRRRQAGQSLGRLLFSLVNLARLMDVDPEDALRRTTDGFASGFHRVERRLRRCGRGLKEAGRRDLKALWPGRRKKRERLNLKH